MKTAFIGIGNVGFAIADNLGKRGHHIIIATNDPGSKSVVKAVAANPGFTVKRIQDAVDEAKVKDDSIQSIVRVYAGIIYN